LFATMSFIKTDCNANLVAIIVNENLRSFLIKRAVFPFIIYKLLSCIELYLISDRFFSHK